MVRFDSRTWAYREDEGTRWKVVMALASHGGNRNWREAMRILTKLASDKRRYVWQSVASALLYLARQQPQVRDTLEMWMGDPLRAKVAETAPRYLRAKN